MKAALVSGKQNIMDEPLSIATCNDCGVSFQPVVPNPRRLAEWYEYMGSPATGTDYIGSQATGTSFLDRRLARTLRALEPFRRTGRLLEVGPGAGDFLNAAQARGWDTHAAEISPTCCRQLEPILGDRLFEGELPSAPFQHGSFDVVVLIEVLEHLANPADYVRAVARLLRPGGCLYLTTPNLRGASGRLWGFRWRVVGDEHLTYFDRSSITRLLVASGFATPKLATTGLDITMLRQWIRPHRRSPPAAPASDSKSNPAAHASSFQHALKDAAVEIVNAWLRALALGDTLKVFATKPGSVRKTPAVQSK